ncbi:MAG: hypothetical protein R3F22_03245 [Lysobacteraceae bacterium]
MAFAITALIQTSGAWALERLGGIAQVAVGSSHACALTDQGGVVCWGGRKTDSLGYPVPVGLVEPAYVPGLSSGVISISTTHAHTCALLDAGNVKCWGMNYDGQLGDGSFEDALVPIDVVGLGSAAQAVFAGAHHSCAILADQSVKCWGSNQYGQLGDGSTEDSPIPVTVDGLDGGVQSLAINGWHSCGLMAGGAVKCWGQGADVLGRRDPMLPATVPAEVLGLSAPAVEISSGFMHVCALTTAGTVECWGSNWRGQLSMPLDTPSSRDPVAVSGLGSEVAAIRMAWYGGCALLASGGIKCWGWNQFGALGNGTVIDSPAPVSVAGLSASAVGLDAGAYQGCALLSTGEVDCWGWNRFGQLGNGRHSVSGKPSAVAGLDANISVASIWSFHGCAVTGAGAAECWGLNESGQLGNGGVVDSPVPVPVQGLDSGISAIATGQQHSCAINHLGGVVCWGANDWGQLGDGTGVSSLSPVNVHGLGSGIKSLSVAGYNGCALSQSGSVSCWGEDWLETYNPLPGMPTPVTHYSPHMVEGLETGVEEITTGWLHGCARLTDGGVRCWGSNSFGQLGNGGVDDSGTPVEVVGLGAVSSIRAGAYHTCALTVSGNLYCWGANSSGQIGNARIGSAVRLPTQVSGFDTGVAAIAAGWQHSCALDVTGNAFCWGRNVEGQLGRGALKHSSVPLRVPGLPRIATSIIAGDGHSCAVVDGQGLHCWGRNDYGQLGTHAIGYSTSAQPVIAVGALRVFHDGFGS